MRRKALCKRPDLKHHLAIARLMLEQEVSCRHAAQTIVDEIGGSERLRAANFARLYRNHLKNGGQYRNLMKACDKCAEAERQLADHERTIGEHEKTIAEASARIAARTLERAILELQKATLLFASAACNEQAADQTRAAIAKQTRAAMEGAEHRVWEAFEKIAGKPLRQRTL